MSDDKRRELEEFWDKALGYEPKPPPMIRKPTIPDEEFIPVRHDTPNISGLVWRRRIFWTLAFLVFAFWLFLTMSLVYGLSEGLSDGNYADLDFSTEASTQRSVDAITTAAADVTMIGIAANVAYSLCCLSFLAFMFFSLLAWRNGVGIRQANQHAEIVRALRRRY